MLTFLIVFYASGIFGWAFLTAAALAQERNRPSYSELLAAVVLCLLWPITAPLVTLVWWGMKHGD